MELGMIGLGRMGAAMTKRLLDAGHTVVAYDQDRAAVERSVADGAVGAVSLDALVSRLNVPRTVWVMVPAGDACNDTIERLTRLLKADDTLIDGGNSNYRDTLHRAFSVQKSGAHFVDVGTSGGIWGLNEGYCLMIGGDAAVVKRIQPLFESLAPAQDRGWAHVGPVGAGHFTKMVHNGIEYGLMQSTPRDLHFSRRTSTSISICRKLQRYGGTGASFDPGCSISPRRRLPRIRH
jgi:6-phosphogluconate dehydrogenase